MYAHNHLVVVALLEFFLKFSEVFACFIRKAVGVGIHRTSALKHGVHATLVAHCDNRDFGAFKMMYRKCSLPISNHRHGICPHAAYQRCRMSATDALKQVGRRHWLQFA